MFGATGKIVLQRPLNKDIIVVTEGSFGGIAFGFSVSPSWGSRSPTTFKGNSVTNAAYIDDTVDYFQLVIDGDHTSTPIFEFIFPEGGLRMWDDGLIGPTLISKAFNSISTVWKWDTAIVWDGTGTSDLAFHYP